MGNAGRYTYQMESSVEPFVVYTNRQHEKQDIGDYHF